MVRESIFQEIVLERVRQDMKWHRDEHGWEDDVKTKLAVLAEEFGEVANAILEHDWENLRTELIQVAAVCVAWLEADY